MTVVVVVHVVVYIIALLFLVIGIYILSQVSSVLLLQSN